MRKSKLRFVLRILKSILRNPDKDFALREINKVIDDTLARISEED